jgi:hypothetical protein
MKIVFLSAILILSSIFANAASLELNANQTNVVISLFKSSGAEETLDGRTASVKASEVSCILERSLGVSCSWKVTKASTHKVIEQEFSEKKSNVLYNLLKSAGIEEQSDGRTSSFNASSVECISERSLGTSCVVTP